MKGLEIDVRHEESVTIAALRGEVDIANGSRLMDEILAQMPDNARGLVIDLEELSYIDSAGIRSIFEIAAILDRHGQNLAVAVAEGSPLRSVLKVTRLEEVADISPSVAAAVAASTRVDP